MRLIYSQAAAVVSWLGLSDQFTVEALRFLKSINRNMSSQAYSQFTREISSNDMKDRILEGIRSLSLRPYWTRVWIIQEVILSSNVYVQCGSECIPWIALRDFFLDLDSQTRLARIAKSSQRVEMFHSRMSELFHYSMESCGLAPQLLSTLCTVHSNGECEKKVDEVFGLWALSMSCCQEAVPIDYSLDSDQVWCRVMEHERAIHGRNGNDPRKLIALLKMTKGPGK
jgi:hypothetical protein